MKAVGFYRSLPVEDPGCFVEVDIPTPKPTGRDLLVRVKAVSVNPVDTKVRRRAQAEQGEPRILGWDAAGVVEAVGEEATLFTPGAEVYYAGSITRPGCDSEYHLVDERIVGPKPRTLSFEEAAALPLTTLTAWEALFDRMRIDPPKSLDERRRTLLILAGAGGVGSIATQIARHVAGLDVIATASRPESAEWCRKMGAAEVIDHRLPLHEELARIGHPEVDFLLCLSRTEDYIDAMARVIKPQGTICTIVETTDNVPVNLNAFQSKSVTVCWELMFTRSMFGTPDMQQQHEILSEASRLFDQDVLQPTLTGVVGPLTAENLRQAHAQLESGRTIGKLVLTVP